MAVRIRLKMMGRKHRPFFRLCAMDGRTPRDGRVLEELGIYDPMVPETDARAILNGERIAYWQSVGAVPSDKAIVLIKKYGLNGTHLTEQQAALERLAQKRRRPSINDIPTPTPRQKKKPEKAAEAAAPAPEAPASEAPVAEAPAETAAE
ncbi:MAG: 30S ribosomal protein S16 [Thermoguttaceae bacterium]